ncbi:putative oxidoreductase [Colletotrichum higginsianum]|uniref:Putative oxidoreductase n=1 Tax=Colletotrichum higginsianum TaxID=80884 RepID=A0A4T0WAK9_9PEZI|nr:putative oxidoreductase [Colletotrichum higginsianum]
MAFVPRIGLGVYQLRGEDCFRACVAALEARYRHIDTAQLYGNEAEVGRVTKKYLLQQQQSQTNETAPAKRGHILDETTKMGRTDGGAEKTYRSAPRSVWRVAGDDGDRDRDGYYVDLLLVHRPVEKLRELWAALERLRSEGKVKAVGVSNFGIEALEEMRAYAGVCLTALREPD